MNWGGVNNGRPLAALYLGALAALYIGAVWVLIVQITGGDGAMAGGLVLFLAGGITMSVLSIVLRRQAPVHPSKWTGNLSPRQRVYVRLMLGLEAPHAWRALRG